MAKVDMCRFAMREALANARDDAYEEWESQQLREEWWDYPEDYPVISHRNLTPYAKEYPRSPRVVLGSRSTAHD